MNREPWYSRLSRVINSAVCFSLAYVLITYLFWYVMGQAGKLLRFDSFVYYYGVKYLLNGQAWTRLKVTFVYSSGPLFCFTLGLLCLSLYQRLKHIRSMVNLFLLWVFVIGTALFSAQGIISALGVHEYTSPFYQNFAVVFVWWNFPAPLVYLLSGPFMILLAYFATTYARPFVRFAYSSSKVNNESRRKRYFIEIAIVPFMMGSLITTAVTFPMNIFVHAVYLLAIGIALMISWAALSFIEIPKDDLLRYDTLQTPSVIFFFLLFIAVFFVYIGWNGINLSAG